MDIRLIIKCKISNEISSRSGGYKTHSYYYKCVLHKHLRKSFNDKNDRQRNYRKPYVHIKIYVIKVYQQIKMET